MKPKSILVLSGGLDSAVSAWIAKTETEPILALTFDYGQKASLKEQASAKKLAERLKVTHKVMSLPWLKEITNTALVSHKVALPHPKNSELDNLSKGLEFANEVWVPNRNGLFLNIAACFAETLHADILVTGFNKEEGLTFPDNSAAFVGAADEFFSYATQKKVRVKSYTLHLNKIDIAKKAAELGVPIKDLWFCYEGFDKPCQRCESCLRDFRAFKEAGL